MTIGGVRTFVHQMAVVSTQMRMRSTPSETKGVVYTKPWVVDLILDLVGYRSEVDLAPLVAVEPAAGDGAFLVPMVGRLLASLRSHGRSLSDARRSIVAFEVDPESAAVARHLVADELMREGARRREAEDIARDWVVEGDYLLSAGSSPQADFVVGNPPYIRYDDLPEGMFATYSELWPTMVGRGDIYVGFIEAALRQLKPGGRLGFICADRWMRSAYGTGLRRFVAETAAVEIVIEMHNAPAFEQDVSAYPAVIVLRRGEQREALIASAGPTSGPLTDGNLADAIVELAHGQRTAVSGVEASMLAGWYAGGSPWPWAEPETLALIQRLEARHSPLENSETGTKVGIGVATGADSVFVTTDADSVESDRLLPLAMARDTRGGTVAWSGHYLIDPWGSDDSLVQLQDYPRLATYFEQHAESLRRRNVASRYESAWYRTIDRVTHSLLQRDKLYFPDMKSETHPVLDRGKTYPHHNLYYVVSERWDLEVLGGLLLSKIAEMFVASYCVKMRGGTLRFQAQYLRRIRVPDPNAIPVDVQARLRDAFQRRDREAATDAAFTAYGLSRLPFVA